MIDLIKFVARGALAGAIFPFVLITLLSLYVVPGEAFVILRALSYWYLIPGALVGLILWLVARFLKSLRPEIRFVVGTLILFAPLFSGLLIAVIYASSENESLLGFVMIALVLIAMASAAIGGIAGLACPNVLSRKKAPELNYWERVALYEIAEREASVARVRSQSRLIQPAKEGAK